MTVKESIAHVAAGYDMTEEAMAEVTTAVMEGQATPAQVGALLTALRMKGETVAEITGAVRSMRALAIRVQAPRTALDTCGTGGDGCHTFNISTAAALIAAAAGLCVAKHGNRAMSGAVGGADVLETLGAKIDLLPAQVEYCLSTVGFGFLLAPIFHQAMRYAAGPRREIGIRTIFNLLGPLTNPAGAGHQLIGVFDRRWVVPFAEVLGRLGSLHALVVHGEDGLDEISLSGPTIAAEWHAGAVRTFTLQPQDFGLHPCRLAELQVHSAQESADVIRAIFLGRSGPQREVVLLNAGAALYAGDAVSSLTDGVALACETVDSGAAARTLDRFITVTQTCSV
jgi:anthranilate phosphoribosyltransferase